MFLLINTEQNVNDGAYCVFDKKGEKILILFEEVGDAERYAIMLNDFADTEVEAIEIDKEPAIKACKYHGYKYTIISPNDIVILPSHYDLVSDN